MKFEQIHLQAELVQELQKQHIEHLTHVQEQALPILFTGRDLLAQSETGSGKTLCFALPIIEKTQLGHGIQSLILAPTRELAKQTTQEFQKYSKHKNLRTISVYGGTSLNNQVQLLKKADIVVGTPGRILDLLRRRHLNFTPLKFLVLDEADRMLDMGFIRDIEAIIKAVPLTRQTMLFSATIPEQVKHLSRKFLTNPCHIAVTPQREKEPLTQYYYTLRRDQKVSYLVHSLNKEQRDLALIFCKTKHLTKSLAHQLTQQGIRAVALNGNMSQNQREKTILDFKQGKIKVLVATDVAARGLHIENITHVYNFELPMDLDSYIHRVGRTARAGKEGKSISIVSEHEYALLQKIVSFYKQKITKLEKEEFPQLNIHLQKPFSHTFPRRSFQRRAFQAK
ncbi:MAG TPA: DEAD/DEAH box helicase [Candidatus Nanoarchaeia archaeon]|nr:DEAD/DEAH box helicase [Candidatus Nanoarchaeia archaeon]